MTNLNSPRFGGIVLAGGRSTRMGRPKAWLPVGGRTMLEAVVGAIADGLADPAAPIVVVGAPGQDLPTLNARVLRIDDEVEGEGPLRGMAAGLAAIRGAAGAAFVSSCDAPFLRPAFVARMLALLGDHDIAVPVVAGLHHPLAAVYRVDVLKSALDLLARNRRRPVFLFETCRTRIVTPADLQPADPGLDSLKNVNTPEDYEALDRIPD
jgi:molybdopterin-guanine dinucleotide biosynthesis protein A